MSTTIELRRRTEPTGDIYFEIYNNDKYVVDSMIYGGNRGRDTKEYMEAQLQKAILMHQSVVTNRTADITVLLTATI